MLLTLTGNTKGVSPRYQSKHTHSEVFRWFENEGFTDVKVLHEDITMDR